MRSLVAVTSAMLLGIALPAAAQYSPTDDGVNPNDTGAYQAVVNPFVVGVGAGTVTATGLGAIGEAGMPVVYVGGLGIGGWGTVPGLGLVSIGAASNFGGLVEMGGFFNTMGWFAGAGGAGYLGATEIIMPSLAPLALGYGGVGMPPSAEEQAHERSEAQRQYYLNRAALKRYLAVEAAKKACPVNTTPVVLPSGVRCAPNPGSAGGGGTGGTGGGQTPTNPDPNTTTPTAPDTSHPGNPSDPTPNPIDPNNPNNDPTGHVDVGPIVPCHGVVVWSPDGDVPGGFKIPNNPCGV